MATDAGGPLLKKDGDLRVTLDRPGRSPLDLTTLVGNLIWSTAAVGGFASCKFTLPGDRRRVIPYLATVRVTLGPSVLWEGRIEDLGLSLADGGFETVVQAFGLRRRLEQTSVRRVWLKRDLTWTTGHAENATLLTGVSNTDIGYALPNVGQFDVTDLTKYGLRFWGNGSTVNGVYGNAADYNSDDLVVTRMMGTVTLAGGNTGAGKMEAFVASSSDGVTYTKTNYTATGSINQALVSNANRIRIGWYKNNATPTAVSSSDTADFTSLRILGTSLTEDASGGMYGGTILRDLIALVPELAIGIIDTGSDFTIQQMDRAVRDTALSVVEEVSGFYDTREWAVWENGRFDWCTKNFDEPQWLLRLSQLTELELTASVDGLVRNVYLEYVDVPTFQGKEASASSTDRRNPFVPLAQAKDAVISVPFLMTSATSAQLAAVLARLQGGYPSVSGHCTVPANALIRRANGSPTEAWALRAGDNITIGELPKTDLFLPGRDGETLFHVSNCEVNLEDNTVQMGIEGQDRRSEVLLARLAAATRAVSG